MTATFPAVTEGAPVDAPATLDSLADDKPIPAASKPALLERTLPLLGIFYGFGLALLAVAFLSVYSHRPTLLIEHGGPHRTNYVITHWLNEGYFHYFGVMVQSPPGKPLYIYSNSGSRLVTGFLVEKLYVAMAGHYSWRLAALHNGLVVVLLAALLGLLAFRVARRLGLDARLAVGAGLAVVLVTFTFPDNLELYYELSGQAAALLCATVFLVIEERALERRTIVHSIGQALAVLVMGNMERVAALAFVAALAVPLLLFEHRRGAVRRYLLVAVLPFGAALAIYGVQLWGVHTRFANAEFGGSSAMFRSGMDGESLYYGDHLDIARHRDLARANWKVNRPYLFRWTWVFYLGAIATLAILAAYARGRAPRIAAEALVLLAGMWLLYAAAFSQAVVIHPYLYDVLLFTPVALALFAFLPSVLEAMNGRSGAILLVALFCAVWYAGFQMRLFALRYPTPEAKPALTAKP